MTTAQSILFTGEVLDDADRDEVMARFRARFGLKEAQVAQVFSGQAVVLKKGLSEAAAEVYVKELATLGMRVAIKGAAPAAPPAPPEPPPADGTYSIVFEGHIVDGFSREAVMLTSAHRLKFSDAQRDRIFSGQRITMKRGLAEDKARHYVSTLRDLGMLTQTEPPLPEPTPPERSREEMDAEASLIETQLSPIHNYNFEETFHSSSTLEMLNNDGDPVDMPPPEPVAPPAAKPASNAATVINPEALDEYAELLGEEDEDPAIAALRAAHDPKPQPQTAPAAPPKPAPESESNVQFDFTKSRAPEPAAAPEPKAPAKPAPAAERHTAPIPNSEETVLALDDEPDNAPPPASTGIPTNLVIAALVLIAVAVGAWLLL
ncbi:MAG: hypothetical protein KDE68_03265 [Rhodocyclaceae bacterium]|nr:hypothetical protein [Rhodocyclaceae bacterium]